MPTPRKRRRPTKPSRRRSKQRTRLGRALEAARSAKNMRQMTVAERIGVSHATVSDWEWGRYAPSLGHLSHLALLFGTTVDSLLASDSRAAA